MIFFRLSAILPILLSLGSIALAQSPLEVTLVDPHVDVDPGVKTSYTFRVDNHGTTPLRYRVIRRLNQLPDTNWASGLCVPGICYPYGQDTILPPPLQPGEPSALFLDVFLGGFGDGVVVLQFDTGEGSEPVTHELRFRVGVASGVDIEPDAPSAAGAPYPNPATTTIAIPLPPGLPAGATTLRLYDARGEQVADRSADARAAMGGSGVVELAVGDLPAGSYFYRLTSGTLDIVRSFVVLR